MIKKVVLDKADRLYHYPFDLEDFYPRRAIKSGEKRIPSIDLGHFHWPVDDKSTFQEGKALKIADDEDLMRFKEAISGWLSKEFGIRTDPRKEIYISQGIHRIIFDLCLAFVEYGDIVLCPEPGMPFYRRLVISVGGVPVTYPVTAKSHYKPSFVKLSSNLGKAARILILNNPNNPSGSMLDETELAQLLRTASRQNIFIINDAAFCSLAEERFLPLRAIRGGQKVSLEVFSVPFTFGLPYLPFGFAVAPPELISGLETIKKTIGASIPAIWVNQTIRAVEEYPSKELKELRKRFNRSRLEAEQVVDKMNGETVGGKSCPFLWVKIPARKQSTSYAAALLRRKRILTLPGTAFGEAGEGYLRLSLTASPDDYREAYRRLSRRLTIRTKNGE